MSTSRFFKILTDSESNMLKLPASFVRKCGWKLTDKVTLKAPNGSVSQVDLVHSDGEIWFHKGWQEFKDIYSIGFGHLLVFEYGGNSHFGVLIFDMTTVEIEYPIDIATDDEEEKCMDNKGKVTMERKHNLDKETSTAYRKAIAFESNNPCFRSLMYPSYVEPTFFLTIPFAFAKENLPTECTEVMLHVLNEGTWKVKYLLRSKKANLSGGWGKFAKVNNLRVGDACVFEVITKLSWNVFIYRGR